MSDPRKVDVSYVDGHWIAQVTPDLDESFDCPSLSKLVNAVRHVCAEQSLIFVVDQATVEGYGDAEAQFVNAQGGRDTIIISSDDL